MSSFICSSKHFNSIERKLLSLVNSGDFMGRFKESEIKSFVKNARELNVLCVSFQYKNHLDNGLDNEIKEQMEIANMKDGTKELTPLGLYNALRCLNYQLETHHLKGINDKLINDTMPMLECFINFAAEVVCEKLPDDKTNRWSID